MPFGDDVFDLKRRGHVGLGKSAVFAAAAGPPPHLLLGRLVHPLDLVEFQRCRDFLALRWSSERTSPTFT
jgi:hypothetical protein